jgi:hypothetical protein
VCVVLFVSFCALLEQQLLPVFGGFTVDGCFFCFFFFLVVFLFSLSLWLCELFALLCFNFNSFTSVCLR